MFEIRKAVDIDMARKKYALQKLKGLVATGQAVDLTYRLQTKSEYKKLIDNEQGLISIGYAQGVAGITGLLVQGHLSGTLYAVTDRTPALFMLLQ